MIILFFTPNISATPKRIVSLKPNITSILLEIGAEDQIVGITRYCIWPNKSSPPRVADYLGPKTEAVAALKPDLVIGSKENSLKAPVEALKRMDINVVLLSLTI